MRKSGEYTNVNIPDFEHIYQRVHDDCNWEIVFPDDCCELKEFELGGLITEGSCSPPPSCEGLEIINLENSQYE